MHTYIDLHCDTASKIDEHGGRLAKNNYAIDAERLKRVGCMVQVFALFLSDRYGGEEGYAAAVRSGLIFDNLKQLAHSFCIELDECGIQQLGRAETTPAAVLAVEDAGAFGASPEGLIAMYNLGVRIVTLVWNYENPVASPHAAAGGLKTAAYPLLDEMKSRGIVCDVSHLSEKGFFDVASYLKSPFIASHSNAHALCNHTRNLSDKQLITLAEHGGVAGLNLYPLFTGSVPIEAHALHIINIAGEDTPAIGTDFDGIGAVIPGIRDCLDIPLLAERFIKAGISPRQTDKIMFKNAQRVLNGL